MKSIESEGLLSEEQLKEWKKVLDSFRTKAKAAGITNKELRTVMDTNFLIAFARSIGEQDWYQDIYDFHKAMGHFIGEEGPKVPEDLDVKKLRRTLIREEIKETIQALHKGDLVELADGIADSIVVLLGTAVSYGIDIRPVWNEVHRTNMAKLGGLKRADGKSLKPEGWVPPDIASLLEEQGM